jgi:hypothetical protein
MKKYFQEVREYLNDNPEGYWFKAKLYGWGWTPARKEGWYTIGIFILLIVLLSLQLQPHMELQQMLPTFFLPLLLLIIVFTIILFTKGERPRWQWGPPQKKSGTQNNTQNDQKVP